MHGTAVYRYVTWAYRGAVLGLLMGIAYDTSAQAAVRNPVGFGAVLLCGLGGAVFGVFVAGAIGIARAGDDPPDS